MLGTLVVDERIFRIARIELAQGRINFWFVHTGPLDLPARSEVRVNAPDGTLIAVAPWMLGSRDRRALLTCTGRADVCFPIGVSSVEGWPRDVAS